MTLLLATCALLAQAQSKFEEDFDDPHKAWEEVAVQLPPAPLDENLLPFAVSGNQTQQFFVDAKSISIGKDGVVRYTMVSRSSAGAKTVSHEGIRCASFERKLYAFGQVDGSWSRSRRDQWERIPRNQANRQHAVLALDYFCDNVIVAGDERRIVERIRRQLPVNPRSERF